MQPPIKISQGDVSCPFCKQKTLTRSRRRGLRDWIMSRLGRFPYRCDNCDRRLYLTV